MMKYTSPPCWSPLTFPRRVTVVFYNASRFPMFACADLALYDRNDRLVVVAEIKNKLGTSREWAARTRRNLLARSGACGAEFFILVTPDRLYMWKDAGIDPVRIPPTYEADAQLEFAPYFESAGVDPRHVGGHAFELLVAAWLGDVIRSGGMWDEPAGDRSWLAESGFHAAVKNGRIEYEAVA